MNKPNLFSFATSELSQDALICWLLEWASPNLKEFDDDLHNCSINLISSFFEKHGKDVPKIIEQVEVRKQDHNIDVLCVINNIYPILIEDKTGTINHSNQLARYLKEVKNRKFNEKNIIPIYFKTEDQDNYSDILKNRYQPYLREDFLKVLNTYKGKNSILIDYRYYLQSISDKVESYKSVEISKWDWYAWVGFYIELKKRLDCGGWKYVANPSGGFLGFWWSWTGSSGCEQYLQLEQEKFCFKICVENDNERKTLRSKWHKIIKTESKNYSLDVIKPSRFGYGEYMTVCILNGEYREVTHSGSIDMEKTLAKFREAEHLLRMVTA